MHLSILLDMSADALADRPAFSDANGTITYGELRDQARALAHRLQVGGHERTVFLGVNSLAVPRTLFASAMAGTAFTPLNYRLTDAELRRVAERAAPAVAIVDADMVPRLDGIDGLDIVTTDEAAAIATAPEDGELLFIPDSDAIGVLLFTCGTTGEPKAAVLRHSHLSSYVLQTLEFASAGEDEAALVSVPPYHIAGISAVISSSFIGRRVVYLPAFTPETWVGVAGRAAASPTRWSCRRCSAGCSTRSRPRGGGLPSLRHLSYGGGRMPVEVDRAGDGDAARAPGFVNAYGLTETSSTIAVLGPDDHREALVVRRPGRAPPARLGRPAEPGARGGDPRRARRAGRRQRARRDLGARRPGVRRVRRARVAGRSTAGSRPTTAAGSTTTASCSSTAGSTT